MLKAKDLIKRLQELDPETIIGVDIGDDLVDAYYYDDNYDVEFAFDENQILDLFKNEEGEHMALMTLKSVDTSRMTIGEHKKELGYYPSLYPPIETWKRVDEK